MFALEALSDAAAAPVPEQFAAVWQSRLRRETHARGRRGCTFDSQYALAVSGWALQSVLRVVICDPI